MSEINFINSSKILTMYEQYFENKNSFVFSECFCLGTIPFDIFRLESADKIRIKALEDAFNFKLGDTYSKRMNEFKNIDYSNVDSIIFHFEANMYSLINLLALINYLDGLKRREIINPGCAMQIKIYEPNQSKSYEESIVAQRFLTDVDLESLSMTFFNLINYQKEKYSDEVVERVSERLTNFPSFKKAIRNYYFIRSNKFLNELKKKGNESDGEFAKRMVRENKDIGLSANYYLSLAKKM